MTGLLLVLLVVGTILIGNNKIRTFGKILLISVIPLAISVLIVKDLGNLIMGLGLSGYGLLILKYNPVNTLGVDN